MSLGLASSDGLATRSPGVNVPSVTAAANGTDRRLNGGPPVVSVHAFPAHMGAVSNLETVSKLVQPIVLLVDKADPAAHTDGVRAAALASVRAYAQDLNRPAGPDASWAKWLSGPFTKTVRRADLKTFRKIAGAYEDTDFGYAKIGAAEAMAFRPVSYEDMDEPLSRLQVSGTTLPDRPTDPEDVQPHGNTPLLVVNASLSMSTGKAAAQASHGLLAWFLTLDPDAQDAWTAAGSPFGVAFVADEVFEDVSVRAVRGTRIVDAGLTETAPNTPTVFAVLAA